MSDDLTPRRVPVTVQHEGPCCPQCVTLIPAGDVCCCRSEGYAVGYGATG